VRVADHGDQHAEDFVVLRVQLDRDVALEVLALDGILNPRLRFCSLSFGIIQFGCKRSFIAALAPRRCSSKRIATTCASGQSANSVLPAETTSTVRTIALQRQMRGGRLPSPYVSAQIPLLFASFLRFAVLCCPSLNSSTSRNEGGMYRACG
jgi:hypothetical protein